MIPQINLMAYRLAVADEGWHAKVISCELPSDTYNGVNLWPTNGNNTKWTIFEAESQKKLQFYVPVTDYIPDDLPPPGTESVYLKEDFVYTAPMDERCILLSVQNWQIIVIVGDCSDFELPFFLTTGFPTCPAVYSAMMSILVQDIRKIPDVADYHERMEHFASTGDKYDRMEYPIVSHNIPLPLGAYLPGTLCLADGRETTAVYRLEEWTGPQRARVTLHCADGSVEPAIGSTLIRRRRSQEGVFRQCLIGKVMSTH